MPRTGFEPVHLSILAFEASVSTVPPSGLASRQRFELRLIGPRPIVLPLDERELRSPPRIRTSKSPDSESGVLPVTPAGNVFFMKLSYRNIILCCLLYSYITIPEETLTFNDLTLPHIGMFNM